MGNEPQDQHKKLEQFYDEYHKRKNMTRDKSQAEETGKKDKAKKDIDIEIKGKDLSKLIIKGVSNAEKAIAETNEDENIAVESVTKGIAHYATAKDVIERAKEIQRNLKVKKGLKEQAKRVELPENIDITATDPKTKKTVRKTKKLKRNIKKGKYKLNKLKNKDILSVDTDLSGAEIKGTKTAKALKITGQGAYLVNNQLRKINEDDNVAITGVTHSVDTVIHSKRIVTKTTHVVRDVFRRGQGLKAYVKTYKGLTAKQGFKQFGSHAVKVLKESVKAMFQTGLKTLGGIIAPALLLLIIFLLIFCIIMIFVPATAEAFTRYPALNEELTNSSTEMAKHADDLYEEIDTTEEQPQWAHIDEFVYEPPKDEMLKLIYEYDMQVLVSYLSARYQHYDIHMVADEIAEIYAEMFDLEYKEVKETRVRTLSDGSTEEYDYYILYITLHVKTTEEVVLPRITNENEQSKYDTYMNEELQGGTMAVANPFKADWRDRLSSRYGTRTYMMDGKQVTDFHTGIDMAYPSGTPVYAGFHGTVLFIKSSSTGYGNHVRIQNQDGTVEALYAHFSSISVSSGQVVIAGVTELGKVGSTGWSSGPHLHIEVFTKENGEMVRQDPIYFVDYKVIDDDKRDKDQDAPGGKSSSSL